MHDVLRRLADRPRLVVTAWAIVLLASLPFALKLRGVARGSTEAIRGSESHAVMAILEEHFGRGSAHVMPVVVRATDTEVSDPIFIAAVTGLVDRLVSGPRGASRLPAASARCSP